MYDENEVQCACRSLWAPSSRHPVARKLDLRTLYTANLWLSNVTFHASIIYVYNHIEFRTLSYILSMDQSKFKFKCKSALNIALASSKLVLYSRMYTDTAIFQIQFCCTWTDRRIKKNGSIFLPFCTNFTKTPWYSARCCVSCIPIFWNKNLANWSQNKGLRLWLRTHFKFTQQSNCFASTKLRKTGSNAGKMGRKVRFYFSESTHGNLNCFKQNPAPHIHTWYDSYTVRLFQV